MRFSRVALLGAFLGALQAQKPVGLMGPVPGDTLLDYSKVAVPGAAATNPNGDTYYFSAWASDGTNGNPLPSLLPLMPDPNGLPIIGTINDGNAGPCSGNIELVQLSKLPAIGSSATSSNTLITPYTNCLTSLGIAPGDINAPSSSWAGHLGGSGDGHNDGTWKGAVMVFRNNILLGYIYRQTSAGNAFGGSTLILSPDAGNTWIDYGRYNTYAITDATCSNSVVTMAVTNSLSGNEKIYVHDVLPSGFNGKQTLTAATSTTATYTLKDVFGNVKACPGAYVSGGNFGPLSANGSGPMGPGDAAFPGNMMFPGGGQMANPTPIDYGQDGRFPGGIEQACDPNVYVCGMDIQSVSDTSAMMALYRVPVGQEMNKSAYQWYTCPGYISAWPAMSTVCDGNLASSWSSNMADETVLLNVGRFKRGPAGMGPCVGGATYSTEHKSYVLGCVQESYIYAGPRYGYMWAPHPWGPWYPAYVGCMNCMGGFSRLMSAQKVVVSSNPPDVRYRVPNSIGVGGYGGLYPSGGVAAWWSAETTAGKLPPVGMARRGYTLGEYGMVGMGHRFTSDSIGGSLPLRGLALGGGPYKIDWWTDLYHHGGDTNATSLTAFPDTLNPADSYRICIGMPPRACNGFGDSGKSLSSEGPGNITTNLVTIVPSFTERGTFDGNKSWTYISVFKVPTGSWGPTNTGNPMNTVMSLFSKDLTCPGGCDLGTLPFGIYIGLRNTNDIGVRYGGLYSPAADFCTPGSAVPSTATWLFLAVTAKANASGFPTLSIYVGFNGTVTEYGGVSLATSPTGASANGITKTCAFCTATPNTPSGLNYWILQTPGGYQAMQSGTSGTIYGEFGAYSGALPSHVIRQVYQTLKADWARVGRGAL